MTHHKRGFAAMNPELHRAIARRGGQSSQALRTHNTFSDKTKASIAGRKGGSIVAARPGHMAMLGRLRQEKRRIAAKH